MLLNIKTDFDVNTDNDYSFSLFDCLLNVLILTFSVCGISYYLWTLLTCVCVPILVTMFPEWLSGTEPLPHTPGAVRPSKGLYLQGSTPYL